MDAVKERQNLNALFDPGEQPWAVWEQTGSQVNSVRLA
jgi:hypothetical protein